MENKDPIKLDMQESNGDKFEKNIEKNFEKYRLASFEFKKSINKAHNITDDELNTRFTI